MKFAVLFSAILLAGCASKPLVTSTRFVPVTVSPELLDLTSCPWPNKADYLIAGTEQEAAAYGLAGVNAWACERATRKAIADQSARIVKDVEARNPR